MQKNTCKALTECVKFLNLGEVLQYDNGSCFTTAGMAYCVSLNYKEMLRLQFTYGTGKVTYCPFPSIICGKTNPRDHSVLALNGNKNTNTATLATLGVDVVQYDSSKLNTNTVVNLVSTARCVILNGSV